MHVDNENGHRLAMVREVRIAIVREVRSPFSPAVLAIVRDLQLYLVPSYKQDSDKDTRFSHVSTCLSMSSPHSA